MGLTQLWMERDGRLAQRAVGPAGRVVLYDINRAMITAGREKGTNGIAVAHRAVK